jgi:uncharacterized protein
MSRKVESLRIASSAGTLEAQLDWPAEEPQGVGLLCHPHPLHGGSMHTKALHRTARALVSARIITLRFNFRGVGTSTGTFAQGDGELQDAGRALQHLQARWPGSPIVLGGFSFGSFIAMRLSLQHAMDIRFAALLALAPPVELFDFGFLSDSRLPVLMIAGAEDPYCPLPALAALHARIGGAAELVVIPAAGHLFLEQLDRLETTVQRFVTHRLASPEARHDAP